MDYLSLGPVPAEEDCAQVGTPGYHDRAYSECRHFITLIRKNLGPEPQGAQLRIKSCPHDFGTYLDVIVQYDPDVREAVEYALRAERDAPTRWEK